MPRELTSETVAYEAVRGAYNINQNNDTAVAFRRHAGASPVLVALYPPAPDELESGEKVGETLTSQSGPGVARDWYRW